MWKNDLLRPYVNGRKLYHNRTHTSEGSIQWNTLCKMNVFSLAKILSKHGTSSTRIHRCRYQGLNCNEINCLLLPLSDIKAPVGFNPTICDRFKGLKDFEYTKKQKEKLNKNLIYQRDNMSHSIQEFYWKVHISSTRNCQLDFHMTVLCNNLTIF